MSQPGQFFQGASDFKISGSQFTDVGRDQYGHVATLIQTAHFHGSAQADANQSARPCRVPLPKLTLEKL